MEMPWQQRNMSMTVLLDELHSYFDQKLCRDNPRLGSLVFSYSTYTKLNSFICKVVTLLYSKNALSVEEDSHLYRSFTFKLQLRDAIYRLRSYSNSLIHILSLSNWHSNVASIQKNRGDKSHRVIVALVRPSLGPPLNLAFLSSDYFRPR